MVLLILYSSSKALQQKILDELLRMSGCESPVPQLLEAKADLDKDHIQWLIQNKTKNKASFENLWK